MPHIASIPYARLVLVVVAPDAAVAVTAVAAAVAARTVPHALGWHMFVCTGMHMRPDEQSKNAMHCKMNVVIL